MPNKLSIMTPVWLVGTFFFSGLPILDHRWWEWPFQYWQCTYWRLQFVCMGPWCHWWLQIQCCPSHYSRSCFQFVMKLFKFISNPNALLTYYFIVIWNWISCEAGLSIDVGNLVYEPPRDGPTLWEIGIPDRSAAEFYVPDPNHLYINKLYLNHPDRLVPFNCEFFVTCIWN